LRLHREPKVETPPFPHRYVRTRVAPTSSKTFAEWSSWVPSVIGRERNMTFVATRRGGTDTRSWFSPAAKPHSCQNLAPKPVPKRPCYAKSRVGKRYTKYWSNDLGLAQYADALWQRKSVGTLLLALPGSIKYRT
jgi:hypothetical protein